MNTNIELALLTRVIDVQDYRSVQKAKIDSTYFYSPEAAAVFHFINETYHAPSTAGCIPSREMVRAYFPTFPFFQSTDAIALLCEHLLREKISVEVQTLAQDLLTKVEADPKAALASLQAEAPRLSALAERSEDYSLATSVKMIEDRYHLVASGGGLVGIPYPWQPLNEATQGLNPQNFIVIYGRPKSMKTWVALKMSVHAYVAARRRVLFYSREMSPEEVLERVACILARVDYNEFINGRLQPEVVQRVFLMLHELAEDEVIAGSHGNIRQPYFMVISDREATDGGGVSWLQAKIEEYDPDIVFVDGMYLMKDDRTKTRTIDWKNITHISQDMKHTARRFEIPIVGITQANRNAEKSHGEDLTELAFADALGMDADAVFRTNKTVVLEPGTKKTVAHLLITAPGLRKGVFHGMIIKAEPGHTFDLMKILTGEDRAQDGSYQEVKASSGSNGPPRLTKPSPFLRSGQLKDPRLPNIR